MTTTAVRGSATTPAAVRYLGRGVDMLTYDPLSGSPPDQEQVVDLAGCPPEVIDEAPRLVRDTLVRRGYAEFTKQLALQAGLRASYGLFSASVDSQFSSTARSSAAAYFARVQATCNSRILSIGENTRALAAHLTPRFRDALKHDTAEEILASFGTHVAVKVEYGGRCSYLVSSTALSELTEQQFTARANAKYGAVSGQASVELTSSEKIEKSEENTTLQVYGGDVAKLLSTDVPDAKAIAAWEHTVERAPGFLGFTEDGLVPIWALAGKRRAELRGAVRRRAARHPIVRIFSRTSASSEWPQEEVRLPDDYKLLCGGAEVSFSTPGNHLIASYPSSDNTWMAQSKSHLKPSPATITVYAVGIYDPADWNLWDVKTVQVTGEESGAPSAIAVLPGRFVLVGGGALDNIETGPGNHLTASYPEDDHWIATGHDHSQVSTGRITAYAIGLRCRLPGLTVVHTITASPPSQKAAWPQAQRPIDSQYLLVGGGARAEWSGYGQILTASYPDEEEHAWVATSKDHLHSDPGRVTAYAVGLKVSIAQ
jgi:hypothetical protein